MAIPRSVLQSMPEEWQYKFVELLQELDDTNWQDILPDNTCYKVELRNYNYHGSNGSFKWGTKVEDPLGDYDRGRRNIFK